MNHAAWTVCAVFGLALTYIIHKGLLLVFFLAIMHLRDMRDAGKLTERGTRWGKCILAVGYFLDGAFNLTWACVEFLDIPRELTVTYRLKRYKHGANVKAWRVAKAEAYARDFLDPADSKGPHV